jgi:hypothetical protein
LPDEVAQKLEDLGLMATREGRPVVTDSGREILQQR